MASYLRRPFLGAPSIARNYSQAWQDIFVLSTLGGLRDNRYLEIGGQQPRDNNNTYLLHKNFDRRGVTLEIDPAHAKGWKTLQPDSTLVIADALAIDYHAYMPAWFGKDEQRIDYLQLDIDPSLNTLAVLKKLPLDRYRFSTITFETDAYSGDFRARDESREILRVQGYELVAANIAVLFRAVSRDPIPFEDWWVDPRAVDANLIRDLRELDRAARLPQDVLFN